MSPQEFQTQINRLVECFGKAQYSTERCKLIWREVQDFSGHWFERVVDKLIGECRYAPLISDFREEISRERERTWGNQKREHENDAKEFFTNQKFDNEIKRDICQKIKARLQGGLNDESWASFAGGIEKLGKGGA